MNDPIDSVISSAPEHADEAAATEGSGIPNLPAGFKPANPAAIKKLAEAAARRRASAPEKSEDNSGGVRDNSWAADWAAHFEQSADCDVDWAADVDLWRLSDAISQYRRNKEKKTNTKEPE